MKLLFIKDSMSYFNVLIMGRFRRLRDWLNEQIELDLYL